MGDSNNARRRTVIKSVGAASAVGLAGCLGRDSDGDGTATVEISSGVGGDAFERWAEAMYEAGLSEDIELEASSIPPGGERLTSWEQTLSTGREKPDIFQMDPQGLPFIDRDYLLNLSEYISDDAETRIREDMIGQLVELYDQDGNLYGYPLLVDIAVMHYRKDLVEDAGYDPDGENWATEPLTWGEFNEVITDAQEEAGVDYGYGINTQHKLAQAQFYEKVASFGGDFFGDNLHDENIGNREITVDDEEAVDALRMMRSFIHGEDAENTLDGFSQISAEETLTWDDDPMIDQMMNDNMIATRIWTWAVPVLAEEFGDDYGTMPIPYAVSEEEGKYEYSGGSRSALGAWYLVANGHTENPEEVTEVLEAMAQPEVQLALFEHQGYAPPVPEMYQSDEVKAMDRIGPHADTLHFASNNTGQFVELNPQWYDYVDTFDGEVMNALRGDKSPEEAMSDMAGEIQDHESEY
ncbi:extracellular solute-binding protein [Halobacteria archaeon AArc-curdl1]|uniref:Extracellular solute-binding protein n=1 Tax=Natronosalvus hydrolyticus TaxID=2979988 RepID=A0AAP2Z9G9_9EURY|nr:extracellular solute-binding protein [Halobacteria archaeon AArc-curdl1]